MRTSLLRRSLVAALALGLTAVAPATAGSGSLSGAAVQLAGGLTSDNVEYVATIPIDSSAVSARVRETEEHGRLLFVSGVKGLSVYDLENPALPVPIGFLPLPHSQNEDLQVSEDGTRAIIAADGGLPAPNPATTGLHIVDTSDPSSPRWQAWLDGAGGGTNHTATCADDACEWIYANRGAIYHVPADAASGDDIEIVGRWWDLDARVRSSHALNRSVHPHPETGEPVSILISDSSPRLIIDVTEPASPVLLATSDPADHAGDGFLQHNNARPNAGDWRPRGDAGGGEDGSSRGPKGGLPDRAADAAKGRLAPDPSGPGTASDPFGGDLAPGELVIGNSESNVVPRCNDQSGGLTTFSIKDFDKGAPMQELHSFRPTNGTWTGNGDPAANGLGCSGHWFDIQDGDNLIAASWYEHGVRVIEVLPDYSMRQVGFFQPVVTGSGAAQWVVDDDGTEWIIATDYARGIDILRFHRDAAPATAEQLAQADALARAQVVPAAEAERAWCSLAGRAA